MHLPYQTYILFVDNHLRSAHTEPLSSSGDDSTPPFGQRRSPPVRCS